MGYTMSKGAFHRMAASSRVGLGPRGIRAFNVEPGYVLTERMAVDEALGFEGAYAAAAPRSGAGVTWSLLAGVHVVVETQESSTARR